jgi:acetyl-CoA C-acetyltransferase
MSDRKPIVLVDGSRSPIGSFGKGLRTVPVDTITENNMRNAMRRAGVSPEQVQGIVWGHAYQTSKTPNLGRHAWLKAGFPPHAPAHTLHIQCGSGMKAVNSAMDTIWLGYADLMVAGGAESMSTIPYLVDGSLRFEGRRSKPFGQFATEFDKSFMAKVVDFISRRFANGFVAGRVNKFFAGVSKYGPRPYIGVVEDGLLPSEFLWDMTTTHMAGTAQRVADTYGITREAMDEYSLRSQMLALKAVEGGRFDLEIDPIDNGRGVAFKRDEHPRKTSLESLAKLRGVNRTRDVTAGNSSGINDGGCALVVASADYAKANGLKQLAVLVDHCEKGVAPETMGLGPVAAINELLQRNNLTLKDIDLFEINEAFAAQYLGCEKLLGLDRDKVNVNGGAIALGHPIAMSGARVILTLAHELKLRGLKRGIASLCIGGGMGIATLIENPDVA